MKKWLIVCLVVEAIVSIMVGSSGCILRRDQVRAYSAWHENPTLENRKELDHQKIITGLEQAGVGVAFFLIISGATVVLFKIVSNRSKSIGMNETAR